MGFPKTGRLGRPTPNVAGAKYGRLTVLNRVENVGTAAAWRCICDCGEYCVATTSSLRHGHKQSCGCFYRDSRTNCRRTHGYARTPTYRIWSAMKSRCYREKDSVYAEYGGRGITVCAEWRESFEAFLRDMGEKPKGATIERRDNDGPYEPANCVWASRLVQSRNRRSTRIVHVDGRDMCLSEACERYGQPRERIKIRLENGWPLMEALTTPALGTGISRARAAKRACSH